MKCANGLVDIMGKGNTNTINMNGENINDKFKMMDRIPAKTIGTNPCQTINNVEPSLVSRAFFSNENIEITPGDRVAQLVVIRVNQVQLEQVEEFNLSARGDKGFGSTGVS